MTLLVILGAGASYDSVAKRFVDSSPSCSEAMELHRPPVANLLFSDRPKFDDARQQFPMISSIWDRLAFRADSETLEDVLARLQEEAPGFPVRYNQLAGVKFYIQKVIDLCEVEWCRSNPPLNLHALVDRIEMLRKGRSHPVFATFNYDRLAERALSSAERTFSSLSDYITPNSTPLYKLHGSVNWVRPLPLSGWEYDRNGSADTTAYKIASEISELPTSEIGIVMWNEVPGSRYRYRDGDWNPAVPAIAIPTRAKNFELPAGHLERFREQLKEVRAILTIGWSGGEDHFIRELRQHATRVSRVLCVGASEADAGTTVKAVNRFRKFDGWSAEAYRGEGFSHFMRYGAQTLESLVNAAYAT